jgi:perosamine synthetase
MMIPVYKPYLPTGSLDKAHDALDSTWLSSSGKYIQMATEKLQEILNVKYVIPLNNGTSACHLMAKCLYRVCKPMGGPGWRCRKTLIVPNNVYVAAWNAFLFDNQYQLITIDADPETWNVDLQKMEDAIAVYPDADVLIVHNVGNIIDVPSLQSKHPNVHFVEDNCEGFLGTYQDQLSGTASFASAISFFGNKNITSGEGGAFVTNSEDAYLYAKCIQGQGQSSKRFVHTELGYNYRMTNVQAAILCGQLDVLPSILQMKRDVFDIYRKAFANRDDIKIQKKDPNTEHSNWMLGVRVPGSPGYDEAEAYFKSHGVEIRPMFYPASAHTHLENNESFYLGDETNAILLNKECFILPSYPELNIGDQNHVIHTVNEYVKTVRKP